MAAAADPTYPLYPIASILAAAMLLLVLLTSFIRHKWNLGVAFLCFWLFIENLTNGINAIIWADNADIKLYIYCDVVTRLQVITSVVKPMATLIITRRLHLIAIRQSIGSGSKKSEGRNIIIEWALGLVIPLIVAGPLYYIVQELRFEVNEGIGCGISADGSILDLLLLWSWSVIPPLLSVTIYYPRVARLIYHQSRHNNRFSQCGDSVSRSNYFRTLALASIDIIFTLPIGITNIVLAVTQLPSLDSLPFYHGWTYDHTDWEPLSFSYHEIVASGVSRIAQLYFSQWTSPVLAFVIFGLFGVTSEARASYWRAISIIGTWFGWQLDPHARETCSTLGDIESAGQPLDTVLDSGLRSRPSCVNTSTVGPGKLVTSTCELESGSNVLSERGTAGSDNVWDADHKPGSEELVCADNTI